MAPLWRIRLLGGLALEQPGREVRRFRTQNTGLLLAYLALHNERPYRREELADLLRPEFDREQSLHFLRQCLLSLRRQFEPPDVPAGSVLIAERLAVRLCIRG